MGTLARAYVRDRVLDRIGLLPAGRVRDLELHARRTDQTLVYDIRQFRGLMYTPQGTPQPQHLVVPDSRGIIEEWSETIYAARNPDTHPYVIKREVPCEDNDRHVVPGFNTTDLPADCATAFGKRFVSIATPASICQCGAPPPLMAMASAFASEDVTAMAPGDAVPASTSMPQPAMASASVAPVARSKPGCPGGCPDSGTILRPRLDAKSPLRRFGSLLGALAVVGLPVGLPHVGIALDPAFVQLLMAIGAGVVGAVLAGGFGINSEPLYCLDCPDRMICMTDCAGNSYAVPGYAGLGCNSDPCAGTDCEPTGMMCIPDCNGGFKRVPTYGDTAESCLPCNDNNCWPVECDPCT